MIPFRKILFPVDFTAPCRLLAPHVKAVAHRFGSEILVIRALDMVRENLAPGVIDDNPDSWPLPAAAVQRLQEPQLQEFVRTYLPDIQPRTVWGEGEPAGVIEDTVKREGADLIMMPTHGGGRLRRLLLGSVTTKVLHDVSCAVWTGTPSALTTPPSTGNSRSILCALDMSPEESGAVLRAGAAMAKAYGAPLHLVHSVEMPPRLYELGQGPYRKSVMDLAYTELQRLRAEADVDATISVHANPIADVIRHEAAVRGTNLVVTGRGRSQGSLRWWSSLYEIVREGPCPVLSV